MTPYEFVAKWRGNTSTERQSYQQHFLDLCALAGHPTPAELDPENKFFTFEAGAAKQAGGNGFADVWYKGHFAIEYKGPDGNRDKAYAQLLQYRESLENPPLLIVGNTQALTIHTNFTGTAKKVVTVTLDDLLTPEGMQRIRNVFYNQSAFRPDKTAEQVTEDAAAQFGRLATHLAKWGHSPHDVAHYLIRLLFCLFSEDIDLLPKDLFTRMVEAGRRDNGRFNRQVRQLFNAMAEGKDFGLDQIRYFDGGLFDDDTSLDLDSDGIAILQGITQLDWSAIEPAILGTLFTRSLDPSKRSQLGAHYTSKDDILLIVEPVLMAPLRREWAEVKAKALELAQRRQAAQSRAAATRNQNELSSVILGFAQKLATVSVLDPACGSGNFLYVALRLLLELWKEVSIFAGEVGLSQVSPLPGLSPSPEQLYGIEINDYAHELAQATVWIGYLQWLHENGYGFLSEPILKPLDNIKQMDAILAYDADGKPVEPEWPAADVIIGNPPFLGLRRSGKSDIPEAYFHSIQSLYRGRVPGDADLVCYWFERARQMVSEEKVHRAGLLATNSIRGGVNRVVLNRIKTTGDIFLAWSDRPWILDGAAVRISVVGFDDGSETQKQLDGRQVKTINSDLSSAIDITVARPLVENAGIAFLGFAKGGPFDVTEAIAEQMLQQSNLNPNGQQNSNVLRILVNGIDVLRRPRQMWVIDFTGLSLSEAAGYHLPFEYALNKVKPAREKNPEERTRSNWWLFRRPGTDMRNAIAGKERYIVTVLVSKHLLFAYLDKKCLPDGALGVFARDDDYFFGVLHSQLHRLWALRMCTWMGVGNDPRYTPTTTFETFPLPWPPGKEPTDDARVQAIAAAAKELVELRDAWLNPAGLDEKALSKRTLTNLYNERPDWLRAAHSRLDAAVFAAYGWPADLSDEEILARLLALNLERATKGMNAIIVNASHV
jgi:hypothetical protein